MGVCGNSLENADEQLNELENKLEGILNEIQDNMFETCKKRRI